MVLGTAVCAAGGIYWLSTRTDEFLRAAVEAKFAEIVPDWNVHIGRVYLDHRGDVRLSNVSVRLDERSRPLIEVPELLVSVDREMLLEEQCIVIHKVTIEQPTLRALRLPDGTWNWQHLPPPVHQEKPLPDIEIHRGTVVVGFTPTAEMPATEIQCRNIDARMTASGFRRFDLEGRTDIQHAGALELVGEFDLNTGEWQIRGGARDARADRESLELANALVPGLNRQIAGLAQSTRLPDRSDPGSPAGQTNVTFTGQERRHTASVDGVPTAPIDDPAGSQLHIPDFGIRAAVDVAFEIGQKQKGSPPDFRVAAQIRDGQITALVVPLYGLNAKIFADANQLVIEHLRAANGESELFVKGRLERSGALLKKDFTIEATRLELDRQLRPHLPPDWERLYQLLSPAGQFNLNVRIAHDGHNAPQITLEEFTAIDCSLLHQAFQYPINGITGTVRQQDGNRFVVDMTGTASGRPVSIAGHIENPGPAMESRLSIRASDIPINETFLNALQTEPLQKVREVVRNLNVTGLVNIDAEFIRHPKPGEKFRLKINDLSLRDGTVNFVHFPYELTDFSGRVEYDPFGDRLWHFRDLKGKHGTSPVMGQARFATQQGASALDMELSASGIPIDQQLRLACITANPDLDMIWTQLYPSGQLDLKGVRLIWIPGKPLQITAPDITLNNGRITLAVLPYPWENVKAKVSWAGNRLTLQSAEGWHGNTKLTINGTGARDAAYVEIPHPPTNPWRAHFDDMHVARLVADEQLRQALPEVQRDILDAATPSGEVDLQLALDMKGLSDPPGWFTAHWRSTTTLRGNDLSAGLRYENVTGQIEVVNGVWYGDRVSIEGFVNVKEMTALGFPFTDVHGPFRIEGTDVYVGSPQWVNSPVEYSRTTPYANQQLIGTTYGGRLGLDAVSRLDGEDTQYRVDMKLQNASLTSWAQDQQLRQVKGTVNAEMTVSGQGYSDRDVQGSGWVQIVPAALYELPVIAQTLSILQFRQPDKTAFRYAYGEFTVHDGVFDFSLIDLVGEAIRLVGRGYVAYAVGLNEEVRVDLFTQSGDQLPLGVGRLPVVGSLFDNWVHVQVTGTLSNPVADTRPLPIEMLRGLLQAIETVTLPVAPNAGYPGRMTPRPLNRTVPGR
ncbi:hypothetical protein [Maioricimonas sp. JC845]|uniref:hypothetical protein n=1 Tax=Maioricimonas sp. JC845 TaxID=3232138 RepID=UPI00345ACA31